MTDILILFGVGLGALLLVVALLQRHADRAEHARAHAEIAEAERRGSARPLAQHPQIDVWSCIGCAACVRACPEDGVLAVIEGVARIVHGSRCVGHERCAPACPVGAITVSLGDLADRDDIPMLSDTQETSVPGVYLAGEVSGIALIRHAIVQGTRAIDSIAAQLRALPPPTDNGVFDVAIVGAGPAGMAAALKAHELGLSARIIEQDEPGGTILHYPRQKLVMTQPVSLPLYGRLKRSEYLKEELVELWKTLLEKYPLDVFRGRLTGIAGTLGEFSLATTAGDVRARAVVLALGRRGTPRKLGVAGEESCKVAYRLVDAAKYRGQKLLVVGGGDSAVEAAVGLAAQPGNTVHLSYRKPHFFRIKARNEQKLNDAVERGRVTLLAPSQVREITEERVALSVTGENGDSSLELPNDYVFVFAGGIPPFELLRTAGIRFGGA